MTSVIKDGYVIETVIINGKEMTIKYPVPAEAPPIANNQPSIEEMQAQTLLNTEYLVARSELGI